MAFAPRIDRAVRYTCSVCANMQIGRKCAKCGHVFTDGALEGRCPACGAPEPDWNL